VRNLIGYETSEIPLWLALGLPDRQAGMVGSRNSLFPFVMLQMFLVHKHKGNYF
jgi:hypothetical protein